MLRRLLAVIVLALLVGGGFVFWHYRRVIPVPRNLGEVGVRVRDAKLITKTRTALSLHARLKECRIQTVVEDGVVTLRGRVADEGLKQRAEDIVAVVPGVRQVVNHIRVSETPPESMLTHERSLGETLDDRALDVRVRLALSLNRDLKGADIKTVVYRKKVTLSGEVATIAQRQAAVRLARETSGVEEVIDRLGVRGADATMAAEAQQTLANNPNLSGYRLKVRQDGVRLIISGRVGNGAEKELAEMLVGAVARGEVKNEIVVGFR
ncbi:MAG: BON domain-containing protein [Vicinamibacteria bacterium]|nr:BON domain-containing protein [Vicinamibacteria bacterium]